MILCAGFNTLCTARSEVRELAWAHSLPLPPHGVDSPYHQNVTARASREETAARLPEIFAYRKHFSL